MKSEYEDYKKTRQLVITGKSPGEACEQTGLPLYTYSRWLKREHNFAKFTESKIAWKIWMGVTICMVLILFLLFIVLAVR